MGIFGRKKQEELPAPVAGLDATRALTVDLLGAAALTVTDDLVPGGVRIDVLTAVAPTDYAAALAGTRGFPEAAQRLEVAIAGLRVTEELEPTMDAGERLDRFCRAVGALVADVAPTVVVSLLNEQVLRPEEAADRAILGLNVRHSGPDAEGDATLDTLGLAWLGLPDLQCSFRGLDPDAVDTYLRGLSVFLLDEGDALRDGIAVQGIDFHDRWKCRHAAAQRGPERTVLDIDPGRHHATAARRH